LGASGLIINFTKLQATGNDFIFIDARNLERDWAELARQMCHRYLGVGADGLILIGHSDVSSFKMRLFNSDGSEAEVSGNGLRCFAKYAIDRKMVSDRNITLETKSGIRTIQATVSKGRVTYARVNMGAPRFKAKEIPVMMARSKKGRDECSVVDIKSVLDYPFKIGRRNIDLSFVSMGNPHAVTFISDHVDDFALAEVGPKIENNRMFPARINFEIAKVLSTNRIEARVWERGAGETLSCGSGACAIAVISRMKGYTGNIVDIMLRGGELRVDWDGVGEVYLSGPVEEVFNGEWPR
jgi:diaminopimelate epimerase